MSRTWTARTGVVVGALLLAALVAAPAIAETTAESSPSPTSSSSTAEESSTTEPSSTETSEPSPTETSEPEPSPTATSEPEPSPTATSEPEPSPTATGEPEPSPTATSEPEPSPTATSEPEPSPTATSEPSPTETAQPSPSPSPQTTGTTETTDERRSLDVTRYAARDGDDGGTVVELDEDIEAMRQLDAPSTGPLDLGANDTIQPAALGNPRSAAVGDEELAVATAAAPASSVRDRIPLGLLAAIAGLVVASASIIANAALRRTR